MANNNKPKINDKPNVNLSFAQLDSEERPEPFVYMTKENKRVTFPDLFDADAEDGEEFLRSIQTMGGDSEMLRKWLTPEDYQALQADGLTLRTRMRLMYSVLDYYEGTLGTLGEGNNSKN